MIEVHRRTGPGFAWEPLRRWRTDEFPRDFFDVDGDGDIDIVADNVIENTTYHGDDDGGFRQYGTGSVGSGGFVPLLGASGPVRVGSTSATLRVRWALGGSYMFSPSVWTRRSRSTSRCPA